MKQKLPEDTENLFVLQENHVLVIECEERRVQTVHARDLVVRNDVPQTHLKFVWAATGRNKVQ